METSIDSSDSGVVSTDRGRQVCGMRVNEAHSNLHLNSAYLGETSAQMVPETAALAD